MFEDALYAIKTAKAAGFYTVGLYDETSRNDQEAIGRPGGLLGAGDSICSHTRLYLRM